MQGDDAATEDATQEAKSHNETSEAAVAAERAASAEAAETPDAAAAAVDAGATTSAGPTESVAPAESAEPAAPKVPAEPEPPTVSAEPEPPKMYGHVMPTSIHCLRYLWDKSTCSRCADICPANAITFGSRLAIDQKACIECALCAMACKTDAIMSSSVPPENLYKRIQKRIEKNEVRTIYLTCSQTDVDGASDWVFTIPCLGAMGPELWFALAAEYDLHVYLPDGLCLECQAQSGADMMFDNVEAAQAWLDGNIPLEGTWSALKIPEAALATEADINKVLRDLALAVTGTGANDNSAAAKKAKAKEERLLNLGVALASADSKKNRLPKEDRGQHLTLTNRRRLLMNVLGHHPEWSESVTIEAMQRTKSCVACKSCVPTCPTGARVTLVRNNTTYVATDVRHCVMCGQCSEVCEHGGVQPILVPGTSLMQGLDKIAIELERERDEAAAKREQRRIDADKRRKEAIARREQKAASGSGDASGANGDGKAAGAAAGAAEGTSGAAEAASASATEASNVEAGASVSGDETASTAAPANAAPAEAASAIAPAPYPSHEERAAQAAAAQAAAANHAIPASHESPASPAARPASTSAEAPTSAPSSASDGEA